MFVGVAAGAVISRVLALVGFSVAGPGLAICGMASVAAAVIGAPVAGVMIILEMTMSYEYALASMLSIVICTMVSSAVFGHSFFDRQLLDRKIDVSQGRGHIEMMETPVLSIVTKEYVKFGDDINVGDAINAMVSAEATEGYVLRAFDNKFLGKVVIHELIGLDINAHTTDYLLSEPVTIKHDASLQQAIEVASDFVGESIPVVNRTTGHFCGVVTEADLLNYIWLCSQR